MKVINLSNTAVTELPLFHIVNPTNEIQGRGIEVDYYSANNAFKVKVGCQSFVLTKASYKDVKEDVKKINGEIPPLVQTCIVKNTSKSTNGNPVLLLEDVSGSKFYIGKNGKAYSKEDYKLGQSNIKPKGKYFKIGDYNQIDHVQSGYGMSKTEFKYLVSLFEILYNELVDLGKDTL